MVVHKAMSSLFLIYASKARVARGNYEGMFLKRARVAKHLGKRECFYRKTKCVNAAAAVEPLGTPFNCSDTNTEEGFARVTR